MCYFTDKMYVIFKINYLIIVKNFYKTLLFRSTMKIDAINVQDDGKSENALNLTAEELAIRKVVYIDFVNDSIPSSTYDAKSDPKKVYFELDRLSRSPLGEDWLKDLKKAQVPIMCCYRVVKSNFSIRMIQGAAEKLIQWYSQRLLLIFHRTLYCRFDTWNQLSWDKLKNLEKEVRNSLGKIMYEGEKTGLQL